MNTDIMPSAQAPSQLKVPPADTAPADDTKAPMPEVHSKPQVPTPAKTNGGVGTAIAATVIIVLGLAALATYAYLQTR